jgi:hypothetical protein
MATAQETIQTGLEALKVVGFGQSPMPAQAQYCLKALNNYIRQLTGYGASLPLQEVRSSGSYQVRREYPAVRVLMQSGGTVTLPEERMADGARIEVVDASGNAAASNITIAGNGWLIDGLNTLTITEDSGSALIMFRADLGMWKELGTLALSDPLPFPADFDEAIALNAAKRYHRFGQRLSADAEEQAKEGARRLYARYVRPVVGLADPAVSNIGGDRRGMAYSVNDFLNGIE